MTGITGWTGIEPPQPPHDLKQSSSRTFLSVGHKDTISSQLITTSLHEPAGAGTGIEGRVGDGMYSGVGIETGT